MPAVSAALPDALDKRNRRSRTPSPRKSKSGGRRRSDNNKADAREWTTPRSIASTKPSPYASRSSEHVRGELRGELKQDPQTRFPVMATSLPPTDTRPGVYEWRFGLQNEASAPDGQRDYYNEDSLAHMNYPTAPEAMSISRSKHAYHAAAEQHYDAQHPEHQHEHPPPRLPSIGMPTPSYDVSAAAAAAAAAAAVAAGPGGGRLSPRLLASAAPPSNTRPSTRQAGNEFYVIPQIDIPNIRIRTRGSSARPKRPMSAMDPKRSSVLVHDWEAALNAANGKYNEPHPPPPNYVDWVRDGSALPTWYVYGNVYDATIWVDDEQLDGRTAEFVVYEKVWGVKPDLGPRDSAATNWKKIQKALKIDVAAANLRPHPEIFDRVTEIRDVMRVAQTKMRRESMLLRVNTAREILACNLATRALLRGRTGYWMLWSAQQQELERLAEERRIARYDAHMRRLDEMEAAAAEDLRLKTEAEEAAKRLAAEQAAKQTEAERQAAAERLAVLHAERAAAEAAAAALRAQEKAEREAEEARRAGELKAFHEKLHKVAMERSIKSMGHRWLLKARAARDQREAEERTARIQLKMLKMQAEIDREYEATLARGADKIAAANRNKLQEEEEAAIALTERENKQVRQIRKACKATIKWIEEKESEMLPGQRHSNAVKDFLITDLFSLPEELVRESCEKSLKVEKDTHQLKERLTKKEMAYLRAQDAKIHMMAENEQIPNAHGEKRPHIVLLSNKWNVSEMVLDPATIAKFENAVRKEHADGCPIRLITYDWEISAEALMKRIEVAVKGTDRKLTPVDPEYFLKAKSITFMVKHELGSLFITKDQLTSMTTLSIPCRENVRVRRWWSQIYDLLTCCGEDIVTGNVVGSRWNVNINMMGYTLEGTSYGETLEAVIATILHCRVVATVDKAAYGAFFDMKLFKVAAQKMKNEKRSEAIGYDITNEDMTIVVRGKIKRKQESFATEW